MFAMYVLAQSFSLFLFDIFWRLLKVDANALAHWHFFKVLSLWLIFNDNLFLVFCIWAGSAANRHCQCVRTHSESSNSVVIARSVKVACYDLF